MTRRKKGRKRKERGKKYWKGESDGEEEKRERKGRIERKTLEEERRKIIGVS
jgi:hypothetical protein